MICMYVDTTYDQPLIFYCFPRGDFHFDSRTAFIVSISRMWPTSIILSAAVILSALSVSASNDPRECEGEIPMPKLISVFSKLSI